MKLTAWEIVHRVQTFPVKNTFVTIWEKHLTYLTKSKQDYKMNTCSTHKHQ